MLIDLSYFRFLLDPKLYHLLALYLRRLEGEELIEETLLICG